MNVREETWRVLLKYASTPSSTVQRFKKKTLGSFLAHHKFCHRKFGLSPIAVNIFRNRSGIIIGFQVSKTGENLLSTNVCDKFAKKVAAETENPICAHTDFP